MNELALTRAPEDRRLYTLDGVGSLRLTGWGQRSGVAEAGGRRWQITHDGLWRRGIQATDMAGVVVGEFTGRALRGGGELRWSGQDFALRRHRTWHERYALTDGRGELAVIEGRSWGRQPVKITADDAAAIDPGLLLFAAFVARALAVAAAAAAS